MQFNINSYCSSKLELISVSKSTMTTIITLIVLVSVGIVTVDGECQPSNGPINNCCCLGYNNNNYNVKSSGVYTIANFCGVKCSNTRVYCDTSSGGGGWTVIQRRKDGNVDFENRDWVEYEDGFGNLHGEFWIGLRSMHCLTSQGNWELRIDYQLDNGTKSYLHYNKFAIGSAEDQYPLNISGFDSIGLTTVFIDADNRSLSGRKFSTHERDNDETNGNCAHGLGPWWHRSCSYIQLNNDYNKFKMYINGQWHYPAFAEMKIKPQYCEIN